MPDSSDAVFPLGQLPDYECSLLLALAFFLGRDVSAQSRACLSMYLRQSEARIMGQVRFYAHQASVQAGRPIDPYELLELIARDPTEAARLLPTLKGVHDPGQQDVFEVDRPESAGPLT